MMPSRSFSFFLRRRRRRRSSKRLSEPVEDGPGYPVQETWVVDKSGSWVLRLDTYGRPYWYNETLGQWTYQIRKPRGPLPVQYVRTPSTDISSPWLSSPVPSTMNGHATGLRSSHSHGHGQLRGPAVNHISGNGHNGANGVTGGSGGHPMSHTDSSRIKPWNTHFRRMSL